MWWPVLMWQKMQVISFLKHKGLWCLRLYSDSTKTGHGKCDNDYVYEPKRIRRWPCGCVLVENAQSSQRGTRIYSVLSSFMYHIESNTHSWCCVLEMRTALHTNVVKWKLYYLHKRPAAVDLNLQVITRLVIR